MTFVRCGPATGGWECVRLVTSVGEQCLKLLPQNSVHTTVASCFDVPVAIKSVCLSLSFHPGDLSMKRLFLSFCFVSLLLPISGCGEDNTIPEIDPAESKKHADEMKEKIEAEMRSKMGGGKR